MLSSNSNNSSTFQMNPRRVIAAAALFAFAISTTAEAVMDNNNNNNGRCDAEFCACYVNDPDECPSWMNTDFFSGSFSSGHLGNNYEAGITMCKGHSTNFFQDYPSDFQNNIAKDRGDATPFDNFKCCDTFDADVDACMCITQWSIQDGENGPAIVNYTVTNPAPYCPSIPPATQPPTESPTETKTEPPTAGPTASIAAAARDGNGVAVFAATAFAAAYVVAAGIL